MVIVQPKTGAQFLSESGEGSLTLRAWPGVEERHVKCPYWCFPVDAEQL